MAECRFQYEFRIPAEELVRRIRAGITGAGGSHSGDAGVGSFSLSTPMGTVAGDYEIRDRTIEMTVTKKPRFIPCAAIERKLNDYLPGLDDGS